MPDDLKGWNWGAFLLPFVWGPFNRVWIGLFAATIGLVPPNGMLIVLALIPYTLLAFNMGLRGNEWAWRARRWSSADHFRRVQRSWMTWGTIGFTSVMLPLLISILVG